MSLLTLPTELRAIIWDYCLGHNYVHITEWSKNSTTTHSLCRSMISDLAAHDFCYNIQNASVSVRTSHGPTTVSTRRVVPPGQRSSGSDLELFLRRFSSDIKHFEYRRLHEPCLRHVPYGEYFQDLYLPVEPNSSGRQLHLALMRTSKFIYEETFETLWTRNTFAFDFGCIFNRFIERRTDKQRHSLRHLVLNTTGRFRKFLHCLDYELDMPTYSLALGHLSALKSVYLNIDYIIYGREMQRFMSDGTLLLNGRNLDVNIIDMLRAQPNLHTITTHVSTVNLYVEGLGPEICFPYSNPDIMIELGKAIDCMIVSRKGTYDERKVNLEIEGGLLQKRGEQWRQQVIDLEKMIERLRNLRRY